MSLHSQSSLFLTLPPPTEGGGGAQNPARPRGTGTLTKKFPRGKPVKTRPDPPPHHGSTGPSTPPDHDLTPPPPPPPHLVGRFRGARRSHTHAHRGPMPSSCGNKKRRRRRKELRKQRHAPQDAPAVRPYGPATRPASQGHLLRHAVENPGENRDVVDVLLIRTVCASCGRRVHPDLLQACGRRVHPDLLLLFPHQAMPAPPTLPPTSPAGSPARAPAPAQAHPLSVESLPHSRSLTRLHRREAPGKRERAHISPPPVGTSSVGKIDEEVLVGAACVVFYLAVCIVLIEGLMILVSSLVSIFWSSSAFCCSST